LCWLATSSCLDLDFPEQPRVLNGQGRLSGESSQEINDLWRELSSGLPDHGETADQVIFAEERHREKGPLSGAHERSAHSAFSRRFQNVRHLDRLLYLGEPSRRSFSLSDRRREHRLNDLGLKMLGGAWREDLALLVIFIDHTGVSARQLRRWTGLGTGLAFWRFFSGRGLAILPFQWVPGKSPMRTIRVSRDFGSQSAVTSCTSVRFLCPTSGHVATSPAKRFVLAGCRRSLRAAHSADPGAERPVCFAARRFDTTRWKSNLSTRDGPAIRPTSRDIGFTRGAVSRGRTHTRGSTPRPIRPRLSLPGLAITSYSPVLQGVT
jgi:hypothetical protein